MVDKRLSHLNEKQIKELIKRYYAGEMVKKLIEEYNIEFSTSGLFKLFPPVVVEDRICPCCHVNMVQDAKSRTSYSLKEIIYCPICKHEYKTNCTCDRCIEAKRNIIHSLYSKDVKKVNINDISLKNRVYLSALLRAVDTFQRDGEIIIPSLNKCDKKIAPTVELLREIIRDLIAEKLLIVDYNSHISAFMGELTSGDYGKSYDLHYVNYILNIEYDKELMNPNIDYETINIEEVDSIARKIALHECLEYLLEQMNTVQFAFKAGKKTKEVFDDLLCNFSVSQIFRIIYSSITGATRYYQEKKVNIKQAANSVITRCQSYGERALANGWEVKSFTRPKSCSQSIISELFFNKIYFIGDDGFYKKL